MPTWKTADEKPHPGCFNVKEAAELTGFNVRQILRAIRQGELFATKHIWRYGLIQRRAWFINKDELIRWVGWKASNKALRSMHV